MPLVHTRCVTVVDAGTVNTFLASATAAQRVMTGCGSEN